MFGLFCILGLRPGLPPAMAMEGFPEYYVAREQATRCNTHLQRLRQLRSVRGWEGGYWNDALAETEYRLTYWNLVAAARLEFEPLMIQQALGSLKAYIGPERFLYHYYPPKLPDDDVFPLRLPTPVWSPANP